MNKNDTCFQGNNTGTCQPQDSSSGVAVGLSLLFLVLAIAIAAIAFIYRSKIRTLLGSLQGRTQKKEVCAESPQADSNTYTGMSREQPQVQTPIYENLGKTKDPLERPAAEQSRLPTQSEEDVYIQCDPVEEGIYSNDPEFNSKSPEPQDEDVYLMPDS